MEGDFSFLKVIARRHKLIWGGDWGTPCQPHKLYAGTPAREQLVGSVVADWPINTGLIESGLTLSGVIEARL